MPRVLNKRKDGIPDGAVYVGRPSPFGNPFKLEAESARGDVLQRYEAWLCGQPALVERARRELAGKDLVCWCAPKACHADILLRIANDLPPPAPPPQMGLFG